MPKKIFFTLFQSTAAFYLMIMPIVSNADNSLANNTNPSISIPSLKPSKNPLLADAPAIAKVSPYSPESANSSSNANTRDVLIAPPKNVIGGSAHQNNQINKYLGVNY